MSNTALLDKILSGSPWAGNSPALAIIVTWANLLSGFMLCVGLLTRVVAFAAGGGLERTRAREKLEQHDSREAKKHANEVHTQFAVLEARHETNDRVEMWSDFLRTVFRW